MNTTQVQNFDLLIEGKIGPSLNGKYFDAINPTNGEVFARVSDADTIDVQMAVSAARLGFDHGRWPQMGVEERGEFLLKIAHLIRENAKELADLECASSGKTIKHTTFIDVPSAAETFEYFGHLSGKWIPAFAGMTNSSETIKHSAPVLSVIEREPV